MNGPMLRVVLAAVVLGVAPVVGFGQPTPAEQKISAARKSIALDPSRHEAYADLALALARRARETSDPAWYGQAQDALDRSLALAPDNLAAERARIWVLLGRHEFGLALERAQSLNRRVPDDLMSYAFLVDANVELGNYEAAEQAAQWLLDLRPGNVAGLTRAAYLRELFGDAEGALGLMQAALQRTPPAEVEERAWLLTQIGHLELTAGRPEAADAALAQALALFPDYHYALGELARVRAAQGRLEESAALLQRRYDLAPHPDNLFEVGEALQRIGKLEEASRAFADFELAARAQMDQADNSNRELVLYYADYGANPRAALEIAQRELERRHDLHTLEVHAWALYRNGRYGEAAMQIERALQIGVREAGMLYRAGAIALAANDLDTAASRLREAVALAPNAATGLPARRLLEELGAGL